jgi:hypothetical protein
VRRLLPLVAIALAFAACGGGTTTTQTVVVATQTVISTETVAGAGQPIPTVTESSLSSQTFQMPSQNIGCSQSEDVLVCDILSGLNPKPKRSCELDWTGMEMERNGPAQPRCAGDTNYDQNAPVLAYGNTWGREGFVCSSASTGLTCWNRDGHGFSLARERWTQF